VEDKLEGPDQVLTYLGIEIDSVQHVIRLPADKCRALVEAVRTRLGVKKCKKRELLSLVGSLSFACKVVKPGRIFLRRLIDLASSVKRLHHWLDVGSGARADLEMWSEFLKGWNGWSYIQEAPATASALELFTDASGVGCGEIFRGAWFSLAWPSDTVIDNCITSLTLTTFSLDEYNLCLYVSSLANRRITFNTIKVYLAAVQYQNMMLGYPERLTNMSRLYELVRGVRRTQGNTLRRPARQPITCLQLSVMIQFLRENSYSE